MRSNSGFRDDCLRCVLVLVIRNDPCNTLSLVWHFILVHLITTFVRHLFIFIFNFIHLIIATYSTLVPTPVTLIPTLDNIRLLGIINILLITLTRPLLFPNPSCFLPSLLKGIPLLHNLPNIDPQTLQLSPPFLSLLRRLHS